MPAGQLGIILRHIRHLVGPPTDGADDARLAEDFAAIFVAGLYWIGSPKARQCVSTSDAFCRRRTLLKPFAIPGGSWLSK